MEKKQVWIDTDLSVGMKRYEREGYSDVDDGYAILQLMLSPKVHINGISAVFGNTRIDDAFRLCNKMANEFSSYFIPVFKGAGKAIDLKNVDSNDAVEHLAESLKKQKLTILAIGPATNIGLLLLKYPELKTQINEVVLVAGRRKSTDYFAIGTKGARARDLNFDLDNTAFQIMFEQNVPVTLCPFEISSKVWVSGEDLSELKKGNAGAQWLSENSEPWLKQWQAAGADGFNPFDVLASHYIITPEDIIKEKLQARLEISIDDTIPENPRHTFKNYLLCDKSPGYPVTYCYDVVSDYHEKLIHSFKS